MSDDLSARHPVVSDKTCPTCAGNSVRLAIETTIVTYMAA
jgi:hypothetical protein